MIEIKNNFLASKMNKDIDARLLPKNQYRHAENLEINRSENSDAGTVQNILGNKELKNFRTLTGVDDLECIGVYADSSNDTLYIFLTNNDSSGYNASAENYIYTYNTSGSTYLLTKGAYLNFSKKFKILGINVLENFLFWTDNRNQPRKINVTKAIGDSDYYNAEEQISVAKLSPLYPPNLYKLRPIDPEDPASGEPETTMYNAASPYIYTGTTIPDPVDDVNPYYNPDYIGDAAYLEDKFVRFSYRYKFEDGEYSIMAPFTQIAYIPKQDGYFLYEGSGSNPIKDDETAAYRSTIVNFMQNKVDQIKLQIVMPDVTVYPASPALPYLEPCPANLLQSTFKIASIEILYKDANDINVSVVESINVSPDSSQGTVENPYFWNTTGTIYEYVYNSIKPFKTLPTKDSTRVNDIVPLKALCQEIISNRVVYSNYQNKASYPKYLDYNVGVSNKSDFEFGTSKTSKIEYPNHSVKENRNYQVGVILSDRFGRESGVILSNAKTSEDDNRFGAGSLYVKYRTITSTDPAYYPGSALQVLFNNPITSGPDGWPGLYNGDVTSPDYNPLGWYSYKIVVKQTEQDYYNVYLPGFMAAYPDIANGGTTRELGKTSHIVLINDNINKVPRDLTEVGPAQLQFRSSVTLYPRVENNDLAYNNQQSYPGNTYSFVNTIATNNSLFFPDNSMPSPTPGGFNQFYQVESDPLIARLSTPVKLGVTAGLDVINLAISETKPVESRLDIYWETSTVGVIADLNNAIGESTTGAVQIEYGEFTLTEETGGVRTVINSIKFKDALGNYVPITTSEVSLVSAFDGIGTNVTSRFALIETPTVGEFKMVTTGDGYFTYQSPVGKNEFTFNLATASGLPNIYSEYQINNCVLINQYPYISSPTFSQTYTFGVGYVGRVTQCIGTNGSAQSPGQLGLLWEIGGTADVTISSTGEVFVNTTTRPPGTYFATIRLKDADGASGYLYYDRSITIRVV